MIVGVRSGPTVTVSALVADTVGLGGVDGTNRASTSYVPGGRAVSEVRWPEVTPSQLELVWLKMVWPPIVDVPGPITKS